MAPTREIPIVDLEAFAEIHLNLPVDYHAELPADVLGLTELRDDGSLKISINRELTESFEAEGAGLSERGRWRATLAHELAHVLFHRELFPHCANQTSLFEKRQQFEPIRCFEKSVQFHPTHNDWREFQANRGMAALLMPRMLFVSSFEEMSGDAEPVEPLPSQIVARLAERFEVSRQAARIRADQLELFLSADRLL